MRASIQRWGNSLALRTPKSFAEDSCIEGGLEVELTVEQGRLVVTRITGPKVTLDSLLAGITDQNRHGEVVSDGSVGREVC